MEFKKIKFVANRPWLNQNSVSRPGPMIKNLPDWYNKADAQEMDTASGLPRQKPEGGGMYFTWKSCPVVADIMCSGYTYKTPCDIEFKEDFAGNIKASVLDPQHANILVERMPLERFPPPQGFHAKHFAWWADWAVELPEGYSALYAQPFNRFDLPFWTMSGIVDNDQVKLPGTMPFFVQKGFNGVIRAGTPYAQIIPFVREHWEAEYDTSLSEAELEARRKEYAVRYRKPEGGVYRNKVWQEKKYQ